MARALRAAALGCAAAVVLSWAPRSAAQSTAQSAVQGGVAGVSVMLLGSAPGRGMTPSIASPQQAFDAPDWPTFSGMRRPPPGPRSPDVFALRPVFFDAQDFQAVSDCLTAASLRRLPLEVCE